MAAAEDDMLLAERFLKVQYLAADTNATSPFRDSVYIAFHGSWNSTNLVGYKVMRVPLQNGKVAGPAEDFATGWLQDNAGSTGRPAGIVEAADGSLLVSDDKGGFIYRIVYAP